MDEELEGEQIGRLSESRRYQAHSIFTSFEPLTMPTVTSINNTPKKVYVPYDVHGGRKG